MIETKLHRRRRRPVQNSNSCKICGAQYPKWLGQCAKCESWNSIEEDIIKKGPKNDLVQSKSVVKNINEIRSKKINFNFFYNYLSPIYGIFKIYVNSFKYKNICYLNRDRIVL